MDLVAPFRSSPRLAHRRTPSSRAAAADLHEPLDALPAGIAVDVLGQIDRAIDRGNLGMALRLEGLLPQSLGAEPALVDRLATLRLLEGDVRTAAAALGACPISTPRLDCLRAIVAVACEDSAILHGLSRGRTAAASLCLQVLGALLDSIVCERDGFRLASEPALAARVLSSIGADKSAGASPPPLGRVLRALLALVDAVAPTGRSACPNPDFERQPEPPATPSACPIPVKDDDHRSPLRSTRTTVKAGTTLADAMHRGLVALAADLGVPLDQGPRRSCGLEVTVGDQRRLHLRAA